MINLTAKDINPQPERLELALAEQSRMGDNHSILSALAFGVKLVGKQRYKTSFQ